MRCEEVFDKVINGNMSIEVFREYISDVRQQVYISTVKGEEINLEHLKKWAVLDEEDENDPWNMGYDAARSYVRMQLGV